ncbi:hypothetical protein [Streptomyces sp. NPDC087297]|uniref:effector-associated constant component EACC1 n=1 Tax=Streptomyces sp. NPDC087297 TaxID=3365778 RepID=UPI003811FD1E
MRLEVHLESGAGELRSMQSWLRSDPDVRRTAVTGARGNDPRPGEMGSALDVLQLVTGNGWSAASFVLALVAWRQTRPQRSRIEIHRGDTVIILTDCTADEIERATRALDSAAEEDRDT